MLIPTLIFSSSLEGPELSEGARVYIEETWAPWWETFRDELRHDPPVEGSSQERFLAARFLDAVARIMKEAAPALDRMVRPDLQSGVESLWHRELQEATADRELGFQLLRQAVEVLDGYEALGSVFERILALTRAQGIEHIAGAGARPASPEEPFEEPAEKPFGEIEKALDPESVLLIRLEMEIFVAFDLASEGSADEFYSWARRAAMTSRQAVALLPSRSSMNQINAQPIGDAMHGGIHDVDHDIGHDIESTQRAPEAGRPSPYEALHGDQDALSTRVLLDEQGATTVLDLLERAPEPNEAMRRLFRDAST